MQGRAHTQKKKLYIYSGHVKQFDAGSIAIFRLTIIYFVSHYSSLFSLKDFKKYIIIIF